MKDRLLGPYRVFQLLGSGGMGRVYMAEVQEEGTGLPRGRTVAVKVLHTHLQHDRESLDRFLREAGLGRRVHHENVVRTYDCDVADVDGERHPYIVMEYVEGQTLRELMHELSRAPEELCRHIGREVARGLRAIHEVGVIHRDLKPDNVLITSKHEVKIMDLGVARLRDAVTDVSPGTSFVGSIVYASPEQFEGGGGDVDGRADLHAAGLILYELATGLHPFRDDDAKASIRRILEEEPRRAGHVNPQLSPFFEEVVHTLLAKDRDARFPSAHDLLQALEDGELSSWWVRRASALRLETRRPLRRVRVPRETSLYGREAELEQLDVAWAAARSGEGRVLLIEGEAGIGKTRLVDEYVGRLQERGEDPNFLFGAYPPGGAATPSGAFSRAYRDHFGPEGLEEALVDVLPTTPALVPAFAALLRSEPAPEGSPPLTKESLQAVFVNVTRALAADRPTIVMIDDLHFAPEAGRALFAALAQAVPRHRVLLIGTMRRGVPESWSSSVERHEHTSRMRLTRLGPKDLVHLLEDAFHSKRLAEELGVKIALKSDGNPFFVFEIIRGLREDQAITQRPDGSWITTRQILDLKVPSSVADLVQARIADLDDEERHLLEVAACCGFEFDGTLVADAIGTERIPAFRRLGHLEKVHHLVCSVGREFAFDHHQVQEALYEGLSPILREDYHRILGEALERSSPASDGERGDEDGSRALALCRHFFAAAAPERASPYLETALDHLERRYANEMVVRLGVQALEAPGLLQGRRRVQILLRQAFSFDLLGLREEQEHTAREAVETARAEAEGGLQAHALSALGAVMGVTSRLKEAMQCFKEARAVAQVAGDTWEDGRAAGNLGVISAQLGRHAEALPLFEQALVQTRAHGERTHEMRCLGNLGTSLLALGRLQEARSTHEKQFALACKAGDQRIQTYASGCLGSVLLRIGRHEDAIPYFDTQAEQGRATGDRRSESVGHGLRAAALLALGRLAEASEDGRRQLEIALEIGDRWGEGRAISILANVASGVGRYAEARAHTQAWLDVTREIHDRMQEAWALHNLGRLALWRGDAASALRRLDEAIAVRREVNDPFGESADRLMRAEVLTGEGKDEDALAELSACIEDAREVDSPGVLIVALVRRAVLGEGSVEEATEAVCDLEARSTVLSRLDARWLMWQLTEDPLHLDEAQCLVGWIRDHAPDDARASVRENVALYRDVDAAWRRYGTKPR